MDFQEVPQLYKCNLTKEIMSDPVVVVETGQIFDKTSIVKLPQGQNQNAQILPLPDLKAVIQKFKLKYSSNQPEESTQEDQTCSQPEEQPQNLPNLSSTTTMQMYEKKVEEVKQQIEVVKAFYEEVQIQNGPFQLIIEKFKKELDEFCEMRKEFENLNVDCEARQILELSNILIQKRQNFDVAVDNNVQPLLQFYQTKFLFEKQLNCLESKEKELVRLRLDLKAALQNLGIEPTLVSEFESSSKIYRQQRLKINENQLTQLFQSGEINNKSVVLESEEIQIDFKIKGQVEVNNTNFSATKNSKIGCIRIFIGDPNTSIKFNNCKFSNVGLFIMGQKFNSPFYGNVFLTDTQFECAPDSAILVHNCKNCIFLNVRVMNIGKNGISVNSDKCEMENVHVDRCGFHGIYFNCNIPSKMRNCSIRNCKEFGLYVSGKQRVDGVDVTFENNGRGDTIGNFVQK